MLEQAQTQDRSVLPADLDDYIGDMLDQLATLAAKRGRPTLAQRIRILAEEATTVDA